MSVSYDWLCKYFATLSWGRKSCVLVSSPESNLDEPVQSVLGGYAAQMTAGLVKDWPMAATLFLLSALNSAIHR